MGWVTVDSTSVDVFVRGKYVYLRGRKKWEDTFSTEITVGGSECINVNAEEYIYTNLSKLNNRFRIVFSGTFDGESMYESYTFTKSSYMYRCIELGHIAGYPSDGGYVRGTLKIENWEEPATTPPDISVPSKVRVGKEINVSWGSSSYANQYQLYRSLDGKSWSHVYSGSTRQFSEIAQDGWTEVKYRVRASGIGGTSGYRESTSILITYFPELGIKVNDQVKISEMGWVKVNGKVREIENIYTKINGVIKSV